MRNFDALDTNAFRAFWMASETLNFTKAAIDAGLTQSGISQHISKLERQLGVPLFERVNKRVFLTEAGKTLRIYVDEYLDRIEQLKEKITSQSVALSGTVSYAMPASCLMTPHLSMLLKKRSEGFPLVKFNVNLGSNDEVIAKVMNNEVHFGFVTKKVQNPGLEFQTYCPETYILIANDRHHLKNITPKTLRDLPFVAHPGVDILFEHWRNFHFPKASNLSWDALDIRGTVNSLNGAISMVEGGVGLSIVPEHCVLSQLKGKTVSRFSAPSGDATNTIYIVTLRDAHHPRRMQKVLETFLQFVR